MEIQPKGGAEAPEHRKYYQIPYFYLIIDEVRARMTEIAQSGELPTTERELTTLQHWLTTDTISDMLPFTLMDTLTFHSMQKSQHTE